MESGADNLSSLEKRVEELKKVLKQEQLKADILNKMVEVATIKQSADRENRLTDDG
jgi:hypothetical protein